MKQKLGTDMSSIFSKDTWTCERYDRHGLSFRTLSLNIDSPILIYLFGVILKIVTAPFIKQVVSSFLVGLGECVEGSDSRVHGVSELRFGSVDIVNCGSGGRTGLRFSFVGHDGGIEVWMGTGLAGWKLGAARLEEVEWVRGCWQLW